MAAKRQSIGFDRKIQLGWLDATADWRAEGRPIAEIRSGLERLLEDHVRGEGWHSARGKTITVLVHVWCLVPDSLAPLRDDALAILRRRGSRNRLPLHWGMCVATYPFFRGVAATTGRLLALQGKATLSQIIRRTAESWGERSTVTRAAQRLVRSLVAWGVLEETQDRGIFAAAPRIEVSNEDGIGAWLVEAGLSNWDRRGPSLRSMLANPAFFPFALRLSLRDLAASQRLEVHRHGLDEDYLVLRQTDSI